VTLLNLTRGLGLKKSKERDSAANIQPFHTKRPGPARVTLYTEFTRLLAALDCKLSFIICRTKWCSLSITSRMTWF